VQLSGHHDADAQVDVVEGETKRVNLELAPIDVAVKPVTTRAPPRAWQWGLIIGGSALLVGGSVVSYATALDGTPGPGEPRDSKYVYNGKALAVAGVGGVAAVAGLVWLLMTPKAESSPTVSLSHDGVQAGWSFTF
jgi:hypothetical protein